MPPQYISTKKHTVHSRKAMRAIGRKRIERTGELSSQGSTNSTRIEPNISSTPPSLSGTARRIA